MEPFFLGTSKSNLANNLIKHLQTKTNNERFKVERPLTFSHEILSKKKTGGHSVTDSLGVVELKHSYADVGRVPLWMAGPRAPNDMAAEVPGARYRAYISSEGMQMAQNVAYISS